MRQGSGSGGQLLGGAAFRFGELIVVSLRAIRVSHGERSQGIIEGAALPHIPSEHSRIGRARVRARERASAQMCIVNECILLNKLADRTQAPVFQFAHVKMSARVIVLRPPQKNVARRLHDMLAFHNPPAWVTTVFGPEAFED